MSYNSYKNQHMWSFNLFITPKGVIIMCSDKQASIKCWLLQMFYYEMNKNWRHEFTGRLFCILSKQWQLEWKTSKLVMNKNCMKDVLVWLNPSIPHVTFLSLFDWTLPPSWKRMSFLNDPILIWFIKSGCFNKIGHSKQTCYTKLNSFQTQASIAYPAKEPNT